jgi:cell wall-associated NlpC family hydrolase
METNKQKAIVSFIVVILIACIPLGAAAPVGISESVVVEAAKSWIGVESVQGGNDRLGIDCSHLVYQVYKQVGAKSIVFQTVADMKRNTNYVSISSPTPGDVIFWEKNVIKNDKKYWLSDHVGICIGNGQFIHTSYDTKKVTIDNISCLYQDGIPYFARWSHSQDNFDLPWIFSSQKSGLNFSQ